MPPADARSPADPVRSLVLHKHAEQLYAALESAFGAHFKAIGERVSHEADEVFLHALDEQWRVSQVSITLVRDVVMYMDRAYVPASGRAPVFELGQKLFRDHVTSATNRSRLRSLFLGAVLRERNGESVDRQLLHAASGMLIELGAKSHAFYEEVVEAPLLEATAEFYRAESDELVASASCDEYLRRAEERIDEEQARVGNYLIDETGGKLADVLYRELVQRHVSTLVAMDQSGCVAMLRDDKVYGLRRMWKLFSRVDGGVEAITKCVLSLADEMGLSIVEDDARAKDPIGSVQAVLDLKHKFDSIIAEAFDGDKRAVVVLNQAFEHFMNVRPGWPEKLSLFLDDQLKRGIKSLNELQVEDLLDRALMLFRFLNDKDLFERYYKAHLSKRLLLSRTVSDDAERSMISKLKTECGFSFTSKLEGMFTDIRLSADAMDNFRASLAKRSMSLPIELSVSVLTTGFWPTAAAGNCVLPSEAMLCCDEFKRNYLATHTGRRLTWQYNLGQAELRARFPLRRHELVVSTYAMCILLLFNNADALTYKDIAQALQIDAGDLVRNLQSLASGKYRVLTKEPKGKDVNETDIFHYNAKFTNKTIKFKIATVSAKTETVEQRSETMAKNDEDRKHLIEAYIVKVMKMRKRLSHNLLVAEVTKQLGARFRPSVAVIKKRLESLLEREYITRTQDDRSVYEYLA